MTHQKNFKRAVRAFADKHELAYTDALVVLNAAREEFDSEARDAAVAEGSTEGASLAGAVVHGSQSGRFAGSRLSEREAIEADIAHDNAVQALAEMNLPGIPDTYNEFLRWGLIPGTDRFSEAPLHIYGGAGSGKSNLLRAFVRHAEGLGWQVRGSVANKYEFGGLNGKHQLIEPDRISAFLAHEIYVRDEEDVADPILVIMDEVNWMGGLFDQRMDEDNTGDLLKKALERGVHIIVTTHGGETTLGGLDEIFHQVKTSRVLVRGKREFRVTKKIIRGKETESFARPGLPPLLSWNVLPLGRGKAVIHKDMLYDNNLLISASIGVGRSAMVNSLISHCLDHDEWEIHRASHAPTHPVKHRRIKQNSGKDLVKWLEDAVNEIERRQALMNKESVAFYMQLAEAIPTRMYLLEDDGLINRDGGEETKLEVSLLRAIAERGPRTGVMLVLTGSDLTRIPGVYGTLLKYMGNRVVFRSSLTEERILGGTGAMREHGVEDLANGHFLTYDQFNIRQGITYEVPYETDLPLKR